MGIQPNQHRYIYLKKVNVADWMVENVPIEQRILFIKLMRDSDDSLKNKFPSDWKAYQEGLLWIKLDKTYNDE